LNLIIPYFNETRKPLRMLRFLISKQTKKQLQSVSNFGKIKSVDRQPACRNGRRGGLKIHWWQHRAGSSPAAGRFETP
jgi:hypothetical protein